MRTWKGCAISAEPILNLDKSLCSLSTIITIIIIIMKIGDTQSLLFHLHFTDISNLKCNLLSVWVLNYYQYSSGYSKTLNSTWSILISPKLCFRSSSAGSHTRGVLHKRSIKKARTREECGLTWFSLPDGMFVCLREAEKGQWRRARGRRWNERAMSQPY